MRTNTLICILIFIVWGVPYGNAQTPNILPDGSFELGKLENKYPSDASYLTKGNMKFWYSSNKNTPDYFHRKATNGDMGIPQNYMGYIEPKEGDGYIGLSTYLSYNKNYREFVSSPLIHPLDKGKTYCISLYVSCSSKSELCSNSLGILFTEDRYTIADLPDIKTQIGIRFGKMIDSVGKWQNLTYRYTATGNEQYFSMGNFSPLKTVKYVKKINDRPYYGTYIYVDDVVIYEAGNMDSCLCKSNKKETLTDLPPFTNTGLIQKTDTIETILLTFRKVDFESKSSKLSSQSFIELDSLAEFLVTNPLFNIDIIGHTDDEGSKLENAYLSVERAKAVKEYLRIKGVEPERMRTRGHGDAEPASTNKTKEGRAMNRRVEIKLYRLAIK